MIAVQRLEKSVLGDGAGRLGAFLERRQHLLAHPLHRIGSEARFLQQASNGFDGGLQIARVGEAAQCHRSRVAPRTGGQSGAHLVQTVGDGIGRPVAGAFFQQAVGQLRQARSFAVADRTGSEQDLCVHHRQFPGGDEVDRHAVGGVPVLDFGDGLSQAGDAQQRGGEQAR